MDRLTDEQLRGLVAFRHALRQFLFRSAERASSLGLTEQQHLLLLFLRAYASPEEQPPSIREVAEFLLIRHHSAVELVARVEGMGLLERQPDPKDQRVVRLVLTPRGHERVDEMAATHREELREVAAVLNVPEGALERAIAEFTERFPLSALTERLRRAPDAQGPLTKRVAQGLTGPA